MSNDQIFEVMSRDETMSYLADNMQVITQVDFVKLLQEHNQVTPELYVKVNSDRNFDVMIPIKGSKVAHYNFRKGTNDDYIILSRGRISTVATTTTKTLSKNYDSFTGTGLNTVTPPNYYTTVVGDYFSFTFTGTGFDFQHVSDNRGGIWEFVIDGDNANKIQVSTWAASTTTITTQVKRGLISGNHSVVATFKGDDPANPPSSGTGTSRGWLCYNNGSNAGKETLNIYDDYTNPTPQYEVYGNGSNSEFALSLTTGASGSTEYFVPDHGVGTAFAGSQSVYFDDQLITNWTADSQIRKGIKSVKIVQTVNAMYPNDNNPMATIYSVHTINARGVSVKVKVKFLRQLYSTTGYGMMFPVDNAFANKFLTSLGNVYDASQHDDSNTDITADKDNAVSYAFVNTGGTNGQPDIVIALTMQDIKHTLRQGATNRRTPSVLWLQHRSTTFQKLYPQVYQNTVINAGETYEIGGTFFIGELPMALNLLV